MLLVVGISVRTYRVTVGADRKKRLVRIAQSGTITLTDVRIAPPAGPRRVV